MIGNGTRTAGRFPRFLLPLLLVTLVSIVPSIRPAAANSDDDDQPTCRPGLVWDKKKQMCVPAQSGIIDDDALAENAYALAREERYDEALQILALARNQNNPKILNYRGYATRKLGRVDEGIRYYKQALAIDPNNLLVRSYLGEAYLKKGNPEKAKALLAEIRDRCGTECEPYKSLAAAIKEAG